MRANLRTAMTMMTNQGNAAAEVADQLGLSSTAPRLRWRLVTRLLETGQPRQDIDRLS
jgi:hypothetical protein